MSYGCNNERDQYQELSIDSSQYMTKPDTSKPVKPSLFSWKGDPPNLFCSTRSGSKCSENATWFSAEEFAKHLVSYKPIYCFKETHTLNVKSGVETRESNFVVYYSEK
tara:strand:+ start:303 stop:626 length:324 start_codon:yes stop_codon:yes gene_type:complete